MLKVQVVLFAHLVLALGWVFLRRLFRGPLVEGWGFKLDLAITLVLWLQRRYPTWRPEVLRALLGDLPPDPASLVGTTLEETTVAGVHGFRVVPQDAEPGRTVLHFHGGGYVLGTASGCREFLAHLGRGLPASLLTVDYRLAPEHPFPAAVDDALAVYQALLDEGQDPAHLMLAGDSAGGGLCFALALTLKARGLPQPGAIFGYSPWVELLSGSRSFTENAPTDVLGHSSIARSAQLYLQGHDAKDPLASPLHGDLEGLPPTFLLAGGAEIFVDDIREMARRLEAAGVRTVLEVEPGMPHTWLYLAQLIPGCPAAITALGRRLDAFWKAAPAAEPPPEPTGSDGARGQREGTPGQ